MLKRLTPRARQLLMPGPIADALAALEPLQRDIIIGLLTGDDIHDDVIAERHGVTEEDVRRQRHTARARFAALRSA